MAKNPNNEEDKKLEASKVPSNETSKSENSELEIKQEKNKEEPEQVKDSIEKDKENNCECCNDNCNCGDCDKCSCDNTCNSCDSCSINGEKKCCAKKLIVMLSLAACILSIFALNKVNKICSAKPDYNIEDKIKTEVKEVIMKNPQLVLDAIEHGLVNKRDNIMEQSAANVENNKNDIAKSAIQVGDANAKFVTICFFDPAGAPCKDAQKVIVDIVKNNKKMKFYLLPVAILGEQSEKLAMVYYQLQALDKDKSKKADKSNKLGEFLQEIVKEGATVDRVLDIIKVNKHELKKYEEIAKNTELLEKFKISSLPAIFISNQSANNKKYEVIHKYNLLSKLI